MTKILTKWIPAPHLAQKYQFDSLLFADASLIIYSLRPVLYDAREGYGEGSNIPGFIAEDVYAIAPHLAILNRDRRPENVAYNDLHALVIKEIQKHEQELADRYVTLREQEQVFNRALIETEELETLMK